MSGKAAKLTPDQIKVRQKLQNVANVLMPQDAPAPILASGPRQALYDWMIELSARDDLKAADVKPRRTALLYGPPGTGKTTFAWHFAARLGLPLVCVETQSLVGSRLGETPRAFASLFDRFEDCEAPFVAFFDEIDSIGSSRSDKSSCDREMSAALNVMLRRVERFEGILLGATNRHGAIDSALWRRFDLQVSIDLPEHEERFAILARYLRPFLLWDDDLDQIAALTNGASPSLLRQLMEGVKRALVLWPRYGRSIDKAAPILRSVVASVAMPPDFDKPALWEDPESIDILADIGWPPEREETVGSPASANEAQDEHAAAARKARAA